MVNAVANSKLDAKVRTIFLRSFCIYSPLSFLLFPCLSFLGTLSNLLPVFFCSRAFNQPIVLTSYLVPTLFFFTFPLLHCTTDHAELYSSFPPLFFSLFLCYLMQFISFVLCGDSGHVPGHTFHMPHSFSPSCSISCQSLLSIS